MGKLKDEVIPAYLRAPSGSPAEREAAAEFERIVDWMMEQGIISKRMTLPNKKVFKLWKLTKDKLVHCGLCPENFGWCRKDMEGVLEIHNKIFHPNGEIRIMEDFKVG